MNKDNNNINKITRREALGLIGLSTAGILMGCAGTQPLRTPESKEPGELTADLVIIGATLGGCAAALSACSMGLKVILTEQTDWVGGQLTSQMVPFDDHKWIETHGCTKRFRELRAGIRKIYRDEYQLTDAAKNSTYFNPGAGGLTKLSCEPIVAVRALRRMLHPYQLSGKLRLLLNRKPIAAEVDGDQVRSVAVQNTLSGKIASLNGKYFIDATDLGDLLPLTGTEYVTGSESRYDTNEIHARDKADPDNFQAFTWALALGYDPNGSFVINKPEMYDYYKEYQPQLNPPWKGKLLSWAFRNPPTIFPGLFVVFPEEVDAGQMSLWRYRRLLYKENFAAGSKINDACAMLWPQNDYFMRSIVDKSPEETEKALEESKQLSLSLLYWLQTEAPRKDGKIGYPGLYLRPDISGTPDGFAKYPYIRESRRIKAQFTVNENHIGVEARNLTGRKEAQYFTDSVGLGCYPMDFHPTVGGEGNRDIPAYPFQIPLGSMLPIRMKNLLPGCKNIGTTHITSSCYRLHPIEWNIGEAAGVLSAFCLTNHLKPVEVREEPAKLEAFQIELKRQGFELSWQALGIR